MIWRWRMSDVFDRAVEAHRRGDHEAALQGYAALDHLKNARHNRGALLRELGRLEEAEAVLRSVLTHFPDFTPSQYSLALTLLAQERYAEGWRLHEARRLTGHSWAVDPETPAPEWRGEDLAGRRLVVCSEQGYGDQLMFARYLPLLRGRGADVTVGCNALMRPLFAAAGFAVTSYSPQNIRLPDCDAWTLIGSLPYRLGLQGPPAPLPIGAWRGGGGIGVVPTGNPDHQNDSNRSLPPDPAARLLSLGRDLRPEATGARSFLDSVALFAGLDLVITVDTSTAHLAGSLGVPTWVLLPWYGVDWRWRLDRSESPWYPSARLFRQHKGEAWGVVIDSVRAALAQISLRSGGRIKRT